VTAKNWIHTGVLIQQPAYFSRMMQSWDLMSAETKGMYYLHSAYSACICRGEHASLPMCFISRITELWWHWPH